jgi:hypothetical protein
MESTELPTLLGIPLGRYMSQARNLEASLYTRHHTAQMWTAHSHNSFLMCPHNTLRTLGRWNYFTVIEEGRGQCFSGSYQNQQNGAVCNTLTDYISHSQLCSQVSTPNTKGESKI